ncbi:PENTATRICOPEPTIDE REPEAT-CONTAINING PROTEIN [Salix koriyanagi]|uniref:PENTATRICOPEPTIDE REPEAT-CONTAINING PROTEIN n=1 Tax=Salix koriyanagi TaxID=2511006 RepID=A0A9Q0PN26_9ROSI|nr:PENTATRICOPEPTIDE REPEAT-CONTAINING PROTEIN [Salix koriyanagi]
MYAKLKSMQDSVKLFQELKHQDIIAWNALISGFVHNGLCQEAIRAFFSGLIESKPNQYSFGSVLNAIGAAEDVSLKYGQRCHSQIIKLGLNTDPIVSSALLDMYAKRGSICESEKVFVETPQQSQFAWTAIISAHARHGDYESVMNWFEEMRRLELRPDSITFLSILTACGRKGMVDTGCHLFDSMVKRLSDRTISRALFLYGGYAGSCRATRGSRAIDESYSRGSWNFCVAKLARSV